MSHVSRILQDQVESKTSWVLGGFFTATEFTTYGSWGNSLGLQKVLDPEGCPDMTYFKRAFSKPLKKGMFFVFLDALRRPKFGQYDYTYRNWA